MDMRPYQTDDLEAVRRIWTECGWITGKDDHPGMDRFLEAGPKHVATIDGQAECFVMSGHGQMRYLDRDIDFSPVYAVTTSRIARRQGLASRLTARCVAMDAQAGAPVSALGMFDQGFYDKLGFGAGCYEHIYTIDPQSIRLPTGHTYRRPQRLDLKTDGAAIHANRLARRREHGGINFPHEAISAGELIWGKNLFALGFRDDTSALTHHLFGRIRDDTEYGPYSIGWLAWNTAEQCLDLLSVIASLGDQVRSVRMHEPVGVQLQDFIEQPMRRSSTTERSDHAQTQTFRAEWQVRINDVPACVERMRLSPRGPGRKAVRFNLVLSDPIESLLANDDANTWRGVAGSYVISLGEQSNAQIGSDDALPTMHATVNAFSRLWLGVLPASSLAITQGLIAQQKLIEQLDAHLHIPQPKLDWMF